MADDLLLPQVPEPKPEDPEDVSWALSTAEAMWARGDHAEGIKWVRRAAEAASEAEDDSRALELAKAAADLTALLGRRSLAPSEEIEVEALTSVPPAPPPPPVPSKAPSPPSNKPSPSSVTKPVMTPSRPPSAIPLPSKASQPPKPLATSPKTQGPVSGRGVLSNQKPDAAKDKAKDNKGKRKSKDNLDAEARAASAVETSPQNALDTERALMLTSDTTEVAAAVEVPFSDHRVKRRADPADATVVKRMDELVKESRGIPDATGTPRTTDEWDASPTQNLTGDDLTTPDHNRTAPVSKRAPAKTAAAKPAAQAPVSSTRASVAPSGTAAARAAAGPMRPPSTTQHDPEIVTTQAVRVVVWRDASGVHVAPAGTVVSAITVDAVLVALDGAADLTAWLSHRDR